jgi:hypothetical protein
MRTVTSDESWGMIASSTKMQAATRNLGEAAAREEINRLLATHGSTSRVQIPYDSELFVARKR